MSLPQRIIEILTVLKENPKGLTCNEILKACKAKPGSEITNQQNVYNLLYSMRSTKPAPYKKIEGNGGVTYMITPHGESLLAQEEQPQALQEQTQAEVATTTPAKNIEPDANQSIGEFVRPTDFGATGDNMLHLAIAPDDPLEMAFFNFIMQMRDINPAPSITNKAAKLKALEMLEEFPLIDHDTRQLLADTRTDLQQLDEAA